MDFDIPREVILPVESVHVTLDPGPHPFESANLAAIDENWLREQAANPALFDGQIALLSRLNYRDRRIDGACHMVRYASFLYWRRLRPRPGPLTGGHVFSHAIPVTSDGALIAIRMGQRTANPGSVYFAAGSFEKEDFPSGRIDVDRNMTREVLEETGIDLVPFEKDATYHGWSGAPGTVVFRRFRVPMTATEAERAIRDFIAAEEDPEIDEPVIIRSADNLPSEARPHMAALVSWHFEEEARSR